MMCRDARIQRRPLRAPALLRHYTIPGGRAGRRTGTYKCCERQDVGSDCAFGARGATNAGNRYHVEAGAYEHPRVPA